MLWIVLRASDDAADEASLWADLRAAWGLALGLARGMSLRIVQCIESRHVVWAVVVAA